MEELIDATSYFASVDSSVGANWRGFPFYELILMQTHTEK